MATIHPNMTKEQIDQALTELKGRISTGRDLKTTTQANLTNAKDNLAGVDKEIESLGVNPAQTGEELAKLREKIISRLQAADKALPADAVQGQ